MEGAGIYFGAQLVTLDDKSRVTVPSGLRNQIPGDPKSRSLFITTHERYPCLAASGAERIRQIKARIDEHEAKALDQGREFDRFAMSQRLFGPGEAVPIDASGRFVLSETLKSIGGIGTEVFLFGAGDFFEVWDVDFLSTSTDPAYGAARFALQKMLDGRAKRAGSA